MGQSPEIVGFNKTRFRSQFPQIFKEQLKSDPVLFQLVLLI